jgi:hypothetical protein
VQVNTIASKATTCGSVPPPLVALLLALHGGCSSKAVSGVPRNLLLQDEAEPNPMTYCYTFMSPFKSCDERSVHDPMVSEALI